MPDEQLIKLATFSMDGGFVPVPGVDAVAVLQDQLDHCPRTRRAYACLVHAVTSEPRSRGGQGDA